MSLHVLPSMTPEEEAEWVAKLASGELFHTVSMGPHGTLVRYQYHRCRCALCREANRDANREYRARAKSGDAMCGGAGSDASKNAPEPFPLHIAIADVGRG